MVRLELIHDVLAIVAKDSRDARHEAAALEAAQQLLAKQRRRQRIVAAWAVVLVACLVGVSWLALIASRGKKEAVRCALQSELPRQQADQQARRAIEQQKLAQSESARSVSAEATRAKSKQVQLADALEKADAATSKAKSEAAAKRDAAMGSRRLGGSRRRAIGRARLRRTTARVRRFNQSPCRRSARRHRPITWWESGMLTRESHRRKVSWNSDGTCVSGIFTKTAISST